MKAYHWRDLIAERNRLAQLRRGEPDPDSPPVNVSVPEIRQPPAPAPATPPQLIGTPRPPPVIVTPAPAITTRRITPTVTSGKPICVECRHYARRMCTSPDTRNPITGTYVEADRARRYEDGCGPKGRQWEARPTRTVEIAPRDDSEPMEYLPPVPFRRMEPFRDEVVAVLWQPATRT